MNFRHHRNQGAGLNHQARSAKTPSLRTGRFASLRAAFAKGTRASAPRRLSLAAFRSSRMSFYRRPSSKESYVRPRRLAVLFSRSKLVVEEFVASTNHPSSRGSRGTGAPARQPVRRLALLAAGLGVSASLAAFALPASVQAASPWWHLGAGARPTYIDPNTGKPGENEIQKITVPLVEFQSFGPSGGFVPFINEEEVGAFVTEPAAAGIGFGTLLTAANFLRAAALRHGVPA
jgi:hypothetical protein